MISALTGSSYAASLTSLFARQPNPAKDKLKDAVRVAKAPLSPSTAPPAAGQGHSAQALLSAFLGALNLDGSGSTTNATDAAANTSRQDSDTPDNLAKTMTQLMGAIDTNGDGTLSSDEVKSAADKMAAAFGQDGAASQLPGDPVPSGVSAKSLYQTVFEAMAAENGNTYKATLNNDLAQKFMASLQQTG